MTMHMTTIREQWLAARRLRDECIADRRACRRSCGGEYGKRRGLMASLRQSGGAADWLSLAAAPTFAIMAVLTGPFGDGRPDILCSAAIDASPLGGMAAMYVLMSAFHLAPWLRLLSSRERQTDRENSGSEA